MTTGEGGMIVTNDTRWSDLCRSLRNQGRDVFDEWLAHTRLGYNYRLDEMSAALGVAQLRRRHELRAGRDRVAAAYAERLGGLEWVALPFAMQGANVDWFIYVVRLDARIDRDRLIGQLAEDGVPSRPYFSPIHLQPFYRERFGYRPGQFPVAERVAAGTLALPFWSAPCGRRQWHDHRSGGPLPRSDRARHRWDRLDWVGDRRQPAATWPARAASGVARRLEAV
jgi:dTDP-4-amino-4,6-dideoxygalactose transaminase